MSSREGFGGQRTERRAPAELLEEAEIEATLEAHRERAECTSQRVPPTTLSTDSCPAASGMVPHGLPHPQRRRLASFGSARADDGQAALGLRPCASGDREQAKRELGNDGVVAADGGAIIQLAVSIVSPGQARVMCLGMATSAHPENVENADHLGGLVYPERQQAEARTEHSPAIRGIIGRRYHGCVPRLIDQDRDTLQ